MTKATPKPDQHSHLNHMQLAFAQAYVELGPCHGRKHKAAVKAGYSPKCASQLGNKLFKNPHVVAYVREREGAITKVIEDKQLVNREQIITRLHQVYAQSMVGEPDMIYDGGRLTHSGLWKFDSRGACRALELLGKCIGMFTDTKPGDNTPFNLLINLGPLPQKQPKTIEHVPHVPVADITSAQINL